MNGMEALEGLDEPLFKREREREDEKPSSSEIWVRAARCSGESSSSVQHTLPPVFVSVKAQPTW